jgi:hypothetical protein
MDNQKNTPNRLPVLSKAVREVLERDWDRRLTEGRYSEKTFNLELMDLIGKENPEYLEMVLEASDRGTNAQSEEERLKHGSYVIGLVKGYEALRRQAEINQLG